MSFSILEQTFPTETDKGIFVNGSGYMTRKPNIDPGWNSLRIGILCQFTSNGTSNEPNNSQMTIGMCSGANGSMASPSPASALCAISSRVGWGYSSSNGWTYDTSSGLGGYRGTFANGTLKAENGVRTIFSPATSNELFQFPNSTGAYQRRGFFMVKITKGSPNYTIRTYSSLVANYHVDYTLENIRDAIALPTEPSSIGGSAIEVYDRAHAFDESYGVLDHIDFSWIGVGIQPKIFYWGGKVIS